MRTVLIFIKAPEPGQVKTRLVSRLGDEGAAGLYRALAQDSLDVLRAMKDVNVQIAYEPHIKWPTPEWLNLEGSTSWFFQSSGDLGNRLTDAFRKGLAQGGPAIAIGSDLPALNVFMLESAFDSLLKTPVVLGPAADGGYYLVGLRELLPSLFEKIPW